MSPATSLSRQGINRGFGICNGGSTLRARSAVRQAGVGGLAVEAVALADAAESHLLRVRDALLAILLTCKAKAVCFVVACFAVACFVDSQSGFLGRKFRHHTDHLGIIDHQNVRCHIWVRGHPPQRIYRH